MIKSSRRRVAAVATTATVGGLLLPFLAAGSALAGTPGPATAITVSPSAVYAAVSVPASTGVTAVNNLATITGTFQGDQITAGVTPNAGYAAGLGVYVATGLDTSAATCTVATPTVTGKTYNYSCTFQTGTTAGTDSIRVYFDPRSSTGAVVTPAYLSSQQQASSFVTVAGTPYNVSLTPTVATAGTAGSTAQTAYQEYTIVTTDVSGRPVPGVSFSVTATEANTTNASNLSVVSAKPTGTYGTPIAPVTGSTYSAAAFATGSGSQAGTSAGLAGQLLAAGTDRFYVASDVTGSVAVSIVAVGTPAVSASATLTVNGAATSAATIPNDVTAVVTAPASGRAFTTDTASVIVNLKNSAGNPIVGIAPVMAVTSGPNLGAANTNTTALTSDVNGNVAFSYVTGTGTGTDVVQAFVNQTKNAVNTPGLDSGEPFVNTSITVAGTLGTAGPASLTPGGTLITTGSPSTGSYINSSLTTKTSTVTFTAIAASPVNTSTSLAGFPVTFSLPSTTASFGKYSLSNTIALTDANGNASTVLTNNNPVDADVPVVTGRVGASAAVNTVAIRYAVPTVTQYTTKIVPSSNSTAIGGRSSLTATATDQFGNAATGATFTWTVTGRNGIAANPSGYTGTGSTFTYLDLGPATAGQDSVSVTVSNASGSTAVYSGSVSANQYWLASSGVTSQANIDLGTPVTGAANSYAGTYTQSTPTSPVLASGFVKTGVSSVTTDPTTAAPTSATTKVLVELADTANNRLYGKTVSLTSSGAGVFTDSKGVPLGTSVTPVITDANGVTVDVTAANLPTNNSTALYATAFVRSTVGGVQNITATVDGQSTTATVTYAGQFVAVAPTRVVDTRTGQGNVAVVRGSLSPGTFYNFAYSTAGMPTQQAAYVFNVTAIAPSGVGFLAVTPGSVTQTTPTTSVVNFQPGKDVANMVVVPNLGVLAAAGAQPNGVDSLNLYSGAAQVNVAIDLIGYYPVSTTTTASITAVTPSRIVDTRNNGGSPIAAGQTVTLPIAGLGGLPITAKAVALNVTVVNPTGLGNLKIVASGAPAQTVATSNINYIPGQDKSVFVIVNLPPNGKVDVTSMGSPVNVAIDALASYDTTASNVVAFNPVRAYDSRTSSATLASGATGVVTVATPATGVPLTAQAVLVSLTAIHTTGSTGFGNLRAYAGGGALPSSSTVNYVSATADVANFAIVPINAAGQISVTSSGSPTDYTVDILGYVPTS